MKGITFFLLLVANPSLFANVFLNTFPSPPVELTLFTVQAEDSLVNLYWSTAREINNMGFVIERAIQIGLWQEIGFVDGNGTTNEPQTYTFKDSLIDVVAERVYYRLKQIDFDGTFQYSEEIEISLQQISLRDTTNQYDYIIITVPEFVNTCVPFKQHKENVRGFSTLIVDTTQIFAEFDSSAAPQDNIRDFISYAGTFWEEPRPKFFLIVGTAQMVPNFQILSPPSTYYQSDYYYSVSIYDSAFIDFYVGRIPAKNTTEIENYFDKVIDYESKSTLESWMNNAQFICQDAEYYDYLNSALSLSSEFSSFIRPYYITENDTSQYYGNIDSIYNAINNRGNSVVWFLGGSNDSLFRLSDTSEIGLEELNGLSNNQKYFFTFFLFNQSSIIDSNTNLTREMIVMHDAGSLGGTVFVGVTYWVINWLFQRLWAKRFFDPTIQSIGEVVALDYLIPNSGFYSYMIKITNLWADPSLKSKYDVTVGIEDESIIEVPEQFTLYQNYPNPFNPSTTIQFALPSESRIKINIYNSIGQLVETLVDIKMESGYHEVNFDGAGLASGIYLYQLQAGEYNSVKKMILLK